MCINDDHHDAWLRLGFGLASAWLPGAYGEPPECDGCATAVQRLCDGAGEAPGSVSTLVHLASA